MNHLAYSGRGRATLLVAGAVAALWLGAAGCTAGVRMSVTGSGGSGATLGQGGSGATGGSGTGGRVVVTGSGGGGGDIVVTTDAGSDAAGCQTSEIMFSPSIPTVFILVDRSGSEFDSMTTGAFFTLRPAVEQVVTSLQDKVRFGFGAFVGNGGNPNCSVEFADTVVPIALNNATAISTEYDSLGPLSPYGSKANTPMSDVIPMVQATLTADASSGSKYMLVVTDSETDFCDDGSAICPADAVTYMVQKMSVSGIGTLVIGLPVDSSSGTSDNIATTVLQNIANAGAGQPVVVPQPNAGQTLKPSDVYDQCNTAGYNPSTNTWLSVYTAAGHTATDHTSIAAYSMTGGTAPVYTPSGTDTQSLINQISLALNSIPRSCTFDLSTFQIDTTKLNEAQVYLVDGSGNKTVLNLDPSKTNGWYMDNITTNSQGTMTSTTLELFGNACTQLRSQDTVDIKFNFPCDLVITIDKP